MNAFNLFHSESSSASATVLAKYVRIPPANSKRERLVYAVKRHADVVAAKGDDDLMSQPQS